VRASLPERFFKFTKLARKGQSLKAAIKGRRPAYSGITKDFIPYTVYDRYKLFPDAKFKGPAIIEEKESTVIVGEDATVSVDHYGFLWVDLKAGERRKAKGARDKMLGERTKLKAMKPKAKVPKPKVREPKLKAKVTKPKLKVKSSRLKAPSAKGKAKRAIRKSK
jgi:hypothetical protein